MDFKREKFFTPLGTRYLAKSVANENVISSPQNGCAYV